MLVSKPPFSLHSVAQRFNILLVVEDAYEEQCTSGPVFFYFI